MTERDLGKQTETARFQGCHPILMLVFAYFCARFKPSTVQNGIELNRDLWLQVFREEIKQHLNASISTEEDTT